MLSLIIHEIRLFGKKMLLNHMVNKGARDQEWAGKN